MSTSRSDGRGDRGGDERCCCRRELRPRPLNGYPSAPAAPTPAAEKLEIPPPPTDPAGPGSGASEATGEVKSTAAAAAAKVLTQEAVAEALGADVPPRDAAERVTFATWAIVTGKSPGGIFNELPALDDETAAKMAGRLSERAEGVISVDEVKSAKTIEELATTVRSQLEEGVVDGFVRTLRAPQEGNTHVPVFVFHPAGGSTVVYEPLLKRLPADTPVYGLERVEGSIEERAAEYVPKLMEINGTGPYILTGWSLGGALAYACAVGLKRNGCDVRFVGLIDTVRAGEEVPQTKEEIRARWDRYALFAQRTFNVEIPEIPYEQLEQLDDEGQVRFVLDAVKESRGRHPGRDHRAPAHVLPGQPGTGHRRTSSPTTDTSRCTWPTATTTTRSCSSRATPSAARRRVG